MLKLENLSCGYGSVEAVHNVTFNVPAGTHNVLVELRPTPIRRWSFYVSLATAVLMTFVVAFTLVTWNLSEPVDKAGPTVETRSRKKARR